MSTRVNLLFHEENKYEGKTLDFLELCGRKKAEIISSIIYAFLEESEIDFAQISKKELVEFFRMYPLMRKAVKNPFPVVKSEPARPPVQPKAEKKAKPKQVTSPPPVQDSVTDESIDRGMAALASFGIV